MTQEVPDYTVISIIIVNWNTCQVTCDCLRSVYEQTEGIDFEVILVDNASTDDSVERTKQKFPQVILIENTENKGFAAANNKGMKIARGSYILLLNSDTVVLDEAIQKTLKFADQHPDAGIIGCRVLNPDGSLQPTCFMYPSILNMLLSTAYLYKIFPNSKFFGRERMTWWQRDDVREVEVVTGCFMLVRREAIEQVGMMDENYFMYGEETDWCWRFKQVGWKVMFTPQAQIIHLGGVSSSQVRPQMLLQLRAGILQFFYKHRPYSVYLTACLLTSLWFGIRIIPWLIKAVISKHNRQQCLKMAKTYFLGSFRALKGYKALEFKRS